MNLWYTCTIFLVLDIMVLYVMRVWSLLCSYAQCISFNYYINKCFFNTQPESFLFLADAKSRVEDIWKKMNSGLPNKMPKPTMTKLSTTAKEKKNKSTNVSNICFLSLAACRLLCEVSAGWIFHSYLYLLEYLFFSVELDDCSRPFTK